jgi:hypothetical protein
LGTGIFDYFDGTGIVPIFTASNPLTVYVPDPSQATGYTAANGWPADIIIEPIPIAPSGGSSGGCDAGLGFAGLMALAGMALLRRRG